MIRTTDVIGHDRFSGRTFVGAISGTALAVLGIFAGSAFAQNLPPTYGTQVISTSDGGEVTVDVLAGGNINAAFILGPPCVGMVSEAPDFRVNLQGSGTVDLWASAVSAADTTLIISTPDGRWLCNDDYDGFNPAINISSARAGLYDIWVGNYDSFGWPQAQLTVSARTLSPAPTVDRPVTPGALLDSGWWYALEGERIGPVTINDIQSAIADGDITRDTLVWRDGMDQWTAATTVEAIVDLFPVEPPPLPMDEVVEEEPVMPPPLPPALPAQADDGSPESGDVEVEGKPADPSDAESVVDDGEPGSDDATTKTELRLEGDDDSPADEGDESEGGE